MGSSWAAEVPESSKVAPNGTCGIRANFVRTSALGGLRPARPDRSAPRHKLPSVLVARRNFITRYGGDEVRLIAGQSHVIEGHPIASANPAAFEPGRRRGARERIVAGGSATTRAVTPGSARLGREPWRLLAHPDCSYRDDGPWRVRLAPEARAAILTELRRTDRDGREIGGLLLGTMRDHLAEVVAATDGGPAAARGRDRFRLDPQFALDVVERGRGRELGVMGFFHSHPAGLACPSEADLGAFCSMREELFAIDHALMVIAVPTTAGWRLDPFVITGTASGQRDRCEPARLTAAQPDD
jgi:proteasome lid subunit RPN8/RPN11